MRNWYLMQWATRIIAIKSFIHLLIVIYLNKHDLMQVKLIKCVWVKRIGRINKNKRYGCINADEKNTHHPIHIGARKKCKEISEKEFTEKWELTLKIRNIFHSSKGHSKEAYKPVWLFNYTKLGFTNEGLA